MYFMKRKFERVKSIQIKKLQGVANFSPEGIFKFS